MSYAAEKRLVDEAARQWVEEAGAPECEVPGAEGEVPA
jgi:hypothetical protein